MKPHFCAIASQQAGEDLIGTAGYYQTYVLIECPMPWAAKVFDSESIPLRLRQYIKVMKAKQSVQFLAINRGASTLSDAVTLMIYERTVPSVQPLPSEEFMEFMESIESIEGYRGYEFQLNDLTQVVDCLQAYWQDDFPLEKLRQRIGKPITQQDILICTHGMRDKCCARFGQPFFREAVRSAQRGELPNTRLWRVSHIGGHRFAPTAISLPDGRYYGRLTLPALQSIVTRKGAISQLRSVYRGWGLLPAPLQVLEQQLMLQQGWSWFEHKINYRILLEEAIAHQDYSLAERLSRSEVRVDVSITPRDNSTQTITYRAKLAQDLQKTVYVKPSCSSAVATPAVKYTVTECVPVGQLQPPLATNKAIA